jgi:hypothetical protein
VTRASLVLLTGLTALVLGGVTQAGAGASQPRDSFLGVPASPNLTDITWTVAYGERIGHGRTSGCRFTGHQAIGRDQRPGGSLLTVVDRATCKAVVQTGVLTSAAAKRIQRLPTRLGSSRPSASGYELGFRPR